MIAPIIGVALTVVLGLAIGNSYIDNQKKYNEAMETMATINKKDFLQKSLDLHIRMEDAEASNGMEFLASGMHKPSTYLKNSSSNDKEMLDRLGRVAALYVRTNPGAVLDCTALSNFSDEITIEECEHSKTITASVETDGQEIYISEDDSDVHDNVLSAARFRGDIISEGGSIKVMSPQKVFHNKEKAIYLNKKIRSVARAGNFEVALELALGLGKLAPVSAMQTLLYINKEQKVALSEGKHIEIHSEGQKYANIIFAAAKKDSGSVNVLTSNPEFSYIVSKVSGESINNISIVSSELKAEMSATFGISVN